MIHLSFSTKKEIAVAEAGKKTKTNEQKALDEIMKKNGYRNGYGTLVMLDDIDPENDTRP